MTESEIKRLEALNAYRCAHLSLIAVAAKQTGYRSATDHALKVQIAAGEFIKAAMLWDAAR